MRSRSHHKLSDEADPILGTKDKDIPVIISTSNGDRASRQDPRRPRSTRTRVQHRRSVGGLPSEGCDPGRDHAQQRCASFRETTACLKANGGASIVVSGTEGSMHKNIVEKEVCNNFGRPNPSLEIYEVASSTSCVSPSSSRCRLR